MKPRREPRLVCYRTGCELNPGMNWNDSPNDCQYSHIRRYSEWELNSDESKTTNYGSLGRNDTQTCSMI